MFSVVTIARPGLVLSQWGQGGCSIMESLIRAGWRNWGSEIEMLESQTGCSPCTASASVTKIKTKILKALKAKVNHKNWKN